MQDARAAREQFEQWRAARKQFKSEKERFEESRAGVDGKRVQHKMEQNVAAANGKYETGREQTRNEMWSDPSVAKVTIRGNQTEAKHQNQTRESGVLRLTTDADPMSKMLRPPSPYEAMVGQLHDEIVVGSTTYSPTGAGSSKVTPQP
mmetsp:Transcript_27520/g.65108  ORF Transcript_27520/g.65108 Transcript_27520/m.65108 type:complete len:148 (-) Transcript_27520:9-452(-)